MTDQCANYALVIDDEYNNRSFAEKLLQSAGLKVCSAGTGREGIALAKEHPTLTLALIDHELPDMTGIELIRTLRLAVPHLMLVMATMHDEQSLIDEAFNAGAICFLVKPNGFIELYHALKAGDSAILNGQKRYVIDQYGPHLYRGNPSMALNYATVSG
jgi:CheY-like chemotaxis protein